MLVNQVESAANILICIIHQTNYLLDKQLKTLSEEFLEQGGFTERLYKKRKEF
ncbi:MAG TPA: four helix bundle suffix domain-containing protein [Patescibacteria group bacterium]